MYEDLFSYGSAIERYRVAPFLDERVFFGLSISPRGARPKTICNIARCQFHLVHLLDLQAGDRIGITRIKAVAEQWPLPGVRRFSKHESFPLPPGQSGRKTSCGTIRNETGRERAMIRR